MTAWICSFHFVQFFTCKRKLKGTVPWDFRLQVFFMNKFPPSPWVGSSYFPRSLCFMWFWFGLEITRMHCCHFTKLYIQTLETIPLKVEWMDFWKEIYKNLFFKIEFSQNQLSHLFIRHFYRNTSIYIITTPSYGVKEEICRRMPSNFFSSTQFQRKRKSLVFFQSINFLCWWR